jgi:hypothetical protein
MTNQYTIKSLTNNMSATTASATATASAVTGTTVTAQTVNTLLTTLRTKYPFVVEASQVYYTSQRDDDGDYMIGDLIVGDLKRTELVSALCAYITGLECSDQTVPPQVMYNYTVLTGLLKSNLLPLFQHLWQTYDFFDKSRLQFYRDGDDYDKRWDVLTKDASPLDMLFMLRWLTKREMTRAFGTSDPDERVKSRDGKSHERCVPENCTFRSGGRSIASLEYAEHCRSVLEAQRLFAKYIPTLTSRRDQQVDGLNLDFFVDAAKIAGRMRAEYKKTQAQTQTQQSGSTQSRPRRRVNVTQ